MFKRINYKEFDYILLIQTNVCTYVYHVIVYAYKDANNFKINYAFEINFFKTN